MRVQSDRPAKNGGYLHPLNADHVAPVQKQKPNVESPPKINVTQIMREWREKTQPDWLEKFGVQLGVSADSLRAIGAAYSSEHRAWAFPMRDGWGEPVGIRLRNEAGRKWAVTGSHQGLFIPEYFLTNGQ